MLRDEWFFEILSNFLFLCKSRYKIQSLSYKSFIFPIMKEGKIYLDGTELWNPFCKCYRMKSPIKTEQLDLGWPHLFRCADLWVQIVWTHNPPIVLHWRSDREVHASQPSGMSRNSEFSRRNLFSVKGLLGDMRWTCLELAVPLGSLFLDLSKPACPHLPFLTAGERASDHIHPPLAFIGTYLSPLLPTPW